MSASLTDVDDVALAPAQSLFEVLCGVNDPRNASGRRHPIGAMLALLVISFCTGSTTVKDAVLFGRHRRWLRKALGFTHPKSPSQSTYTRLFKVLPVESVREPVCQWLAGLVELWNQRRSRQISACVDGKALRGAGIHTLNIFVQDLWTLLDQYEVGEKANEMSVFRERLDEFVTRYPFVRIVTFDALFCEQGTMHSLTEHNRMGIFQVKGNQPEALERIERWFAALPKAAPDWRETEKKRGLHRHTGTVGAPCPA